MSSDYPAEVNISEIFYSVQGEGLYAGEPTVFVRLQGCSLGCCWCDSKYTWSNRKSNTKSINEIVREVEDLHSKAARKPWICITGGEPLEQPEAFHDLATTFHSLDYKIEVETSGLVPIPFDDNDLIDSWVVDLKCPDAEANKDPVLEDLDRLRDQDQLKCVVLSMRDVDFIEDTLSKVDCSANVLISPVASNDSLFSDGLMKTCAEFCKKHSYRLSLQTHKVIWGVKRGV